MPNFIPKGIRWNALNNCRKWSEQWGPLHIRDNNGRSALSEARQRRGGAEILELVEAAAARCGSSVNDDIPLHS